MRRLLPLFRVRYRHIAKILRCYRVTAVTGVPITTLGRPAPSQPLKCFDPVTEVTEETKGIPPETGRETAGNRPVTTAGLPADAATPSPGFRDPDRRYLPPPVRNTPRSLSYGDVR
jgi:hypothetical protein